MARLTVHHWIPTSRGGTEKETVLIPESLHRYYHHLFGNRVPIESEAYLERIHENGLASLTPVKQRAYSKLFEGLTQDEAEEFLMVLHIAFSEFKILPEEMIEVVRSALRRSS